MPKGAVTPASIPSRSVRFGESPSVRRMPAIGRSETLRLKGLSPGLRTPMYPYLALRCPIYRENSHANHTWRQHSHETA